MIFFIIQIFDLILIWNKILRHLFDLKKFEEKELKSKFDLKKFEFISYKNIWFEEKLKHILDLKFDLK